MNTAAKIRTVSAAIITTFTLTGCEGISPNSTVPQEFKVGQAAFHKSCANCHGPDADGSKKRGPGLIQEVYFEKNFGDKKIERTILKGSSSGAMPSQENRVTKSQVPKIVKYLRYLQKEKMVKDQARTG
jgi:mono/diheme cytochrome c family protein